MTDNQLEPCIKLPLEDGVLADIVEKAKDWALMHGKKTCTCTLIVIIFLLLDYCL